MWSTTLDAYERQPAQLIRAVHAHGPVRIEGDGEALRDFQRELPRVGPRLNLEVRTRRDDSQLIPALIVRPKR